MRKTVVAYVIVLAVSGLGQTPSSNPLNAKQVVQQTIAVLSTGPSANAITDFALKGNIVMEGTSESQDIQILTRGSGDSRFEIRGAAGVHLTVTRAGKDGGIRDASGKTTNIKRNVRAGTEVPFLPLPKRLSDLLASAGTIADLGNDTVDGKAVRHVAITRHFPDGFDPDGKATALSRIDLFIDSSTFLPLKMAHSAADITGRRTVHRAVSFSDFRTLGDVVVPFGIAEEVDDQPTWSLTVTSIDFNHKFQDSDFQL